MSDVRPQDVLLRVGGLTLKRLQTLAAFGPGRGVEVPYTFTRADATTCATYIDRDGTLRLAVAGVPRIEWVDLDGDGARETPGISLEGTRTNVALWNRDLSNAAWTKTTMTAAKDQTGVDGVTNSASSLLATAGNATCLQAIVLGSSARAQTAWVKRLVGSGTINMTMDNGATWTVITLTTSWTRLTIPSQTLANPTVGFRIVTNTDKIAVDYVQNENGTFQSSAIATTAAAVTRAADALSTTFNFGPMDLTVLARIARPAYADLVGDLGSGVRPGIFQVGVSNTLNGFFERLTRDLISEVRGSSNQDATQPIPAGATILYCAQFTGFSSAAKSKLDVGSGFSAFSSTSPFTTGFGTRTLTVGSSNPGAVTELYGVLVDLVFARGLFTISEMSAVP